LANIGGVKPGHAALTVELVFAESTVTSAFATSPMKLLTPRSRGESVWGYTSSFGGGLVAGDQTQLDVTLGAGTRCYIGTQASTKVYRNPGRRPCGHTTRAVVGEGALLVFAPDSVQAYENSIYSQQQEFHLEKDAGLALLDWFSAGRAARGERWAFAGFQSRNDVFLSGERVFVDSLLLDPDNGAVTSDHCAGRFNCFAMLLLLGDALRETTSRCLEQIALRPVERKGCLVCSASPLRDGALLRVAGESVELVGRELHHYLQPLTALLGDDPWARKW